MKQSKACMGAIAALGMLLLILDSKTALSGAQEGLSLCLQTVIPSLFPFFVLSSLLTGSLLGDRLPLLRPVGKFLRIPDGSEAILAAGFLGGYPIGAQSISGAHSLGQLSSQDARRMLAFCNNAGPAFLFGMAASLFPYGWMPWALWAINILSALLVARLLPGRPEGKTIAIRSKPITIPDAVRRSLHSMALVCGWVILFRVIIAFCDRWFGWLLPTAGQVILAGILELSNGCCALISVENMGMRFVICSGFLAFGGLCVTLQTLSAADGVDVSLYFPGKLLQTVFSLSLAALVQRLLPGDLVWRIPVILPASIFLLPLFPFLCIKNRNKSRNPVPLRV